MTRAQLLDEVMPAAIFVTTENDRHLELPQERAAKRQSLIPLLSKGPGKKCADNDLP